jgi:hypothetical protein
LKNRELVQVERQRALKFFKSKRVLFCCLLYESSSLPKCISQNRFFLCEYFASGILNSVFVSGITGMSLR